MKLLLIAAAIIVAIPAAFALFVLGTETGFEWFRNHFK